MKEGVNQGCPLSPIFATLVLHRVLESLANSLKERAQARLATGYKGDDGCGSIAHLFAYMDDISSTVPHEDVQFFCQEIDKLGATKGCFVNPLKTRILTSCSGNSILPMLNASNHTLATEIENTIATYSIKQNKDDSLSPVELTDGFRLLGTPVGSKLFAESFYDEQLELVTSSLKSLETSITDIHTRLKLFTQCVLQKLPHLLDSDIMHNYPIDNTSNNNWYNWEGTLTFGIDGLIDSFLRNILDIDDDSYIPTYSILIAQLNTNKGGLRFLNASIRAALDFVLNTMLCKQRALHGFRINSDIKPILPHPSISDIFAITTNNSSLVLQRYHALLPHIAPLSCPPSCPSMETTTTFENYTSLHSACTRLKKHFANIITGQIYTNVGTSTPEHFHLLPSILSPQMSYPLVGMCRSNAQHRLPNWATQIAIKQKLPLPIYDPTNTPTCKCGQKHNCFGDHTFKCKKISKKLSHNIVRDSCAKALQPALSQAGYIRPSTQLETEKKHIKTQDISAQPFDVSFDPDPPITDTIHTYCPYSTIGADITITHSASTPSTFDISDNAISSVTALADKHIQMFERKKYMRNNKTDATNPSTRINGDAVIGDLLQQNMILLPFAIDPHGRFGLILTHFLFQPTANLAFDFPPSRPNAKLMFAKSTSSPSPIGLLRTADCLWKQNKQRPFFGHSYTAPTPSLFTIQQLGLGITKAFTTHIRNATRTYQGTNQRESNSTHAFDHTIVQ